MSNPVRVFVDPEFYDKCKKEQQKFQEKTGLKISFRKITQQIAKSTSNLEYPELNIFGKGKHVKKN